MGVYKIVFKNKRQSFSINSDSPQEAVRNHFAKYGKKVEIQLGSQNNSNVRVTLAGGNRHNYYNVTVISASPIAQKPLTKTEFKKSKRQEIIDANWKSPNGVCEKLSGREIVLYHGSRDGIIGNIQPSSRGRCDFGAAFYCGNQKEQAELLIKDNGTMKILYTVVVDLSNLNVYTFEDTVSWALYIAAKRKIIDVEKYGKIKKLMEFVDSHDVICGLIADDEMTQAFGEFLGGSLTENGLAYCLAKVDLGYQYAFKTPVSCKAIHYKNIEPLSKERLSELQVFHNNMITQKTGVVEYALDNIDGKTFRQLIKEWI